MAVISSLVVVSVPVVAVLLLVGSVCSDDTDDSSDRVLLGSWLAAAAATATTTGVCCCCSSGCAGPPLCFVASTPVLGLSWMNWGGTWPPTAGLDFDFFAVCIITGCCCCCCCSDGAGGECRWGPFFSGALDGTNPMLPFMLTTCHQFRCRALV
uniref:Secreted peptide n=1 Tax=Anopheles merus TaxID=30066 RepID=A0A182UN90_ANOME